MTENLATYNDVILQILIAIGLVCAIAIVLFVTAVVLVLAYRRAKAIYEKQEQEENLRNKKRIQKERNYVITSMLTVAGAAVLFIILAIVANKEWGLDILPDNVVLTFVGIIATFIVVTNYAQVTDIKRELKEEIRKLNKRTNALYKRPLPGTGNDNAQEL